MVNDRAQLIKFGENLRKLRKAKDLSLRQLSINCNIDNSKISKIERGEINITLTSIFELARGLNIEPFELLKF